MLEQDILQRRIASEGTSDQPVDAWCSDVEAYGLFGKEESEVQPKFES